jgi:hypothetical protein
VWISKIRRHILAVTKDQIVRPYLNSSYLFSGSQKSLTRLTLPFPQIYIIIIYYWTCFRDEYSWNTGNWALNNNQSINHLQFISNHFLISSVFLSLKKKFKLWFKTIKKKPINFSWNILVLSPGIRWFEVYDQVNLLDYKNRMIFHTHSWII